MTYKAVIFDFDGVLCHDYFYSNLADNHPKVSQFIESKVFGGQSNIPDRWMRGKLTSDHVNKYISKNTGIDFSELKQLFVESVKLMKVDKRLLNLARDLRDKGTKIALVTSNMDVFNEITIKNHNLDKIFPVIVNSCDYGFLKHENDGKLYDIAFEGIGEKSYKNTLLIDDSSRARAMFESKGGAAFPFISYEDFEPWMRENLKRNRR